MRKLVGILGMLIIGTVFVAGFVAYFVYHTEPTTKIMHDGFGRSLSESPYLMRWIFGQDRLWAGWTWFIVDMIVFWGGSIAGLGLATWGFNESNDEPIDDAGEPPA